MPLNIQVHYIVLRCLEFYFYWPMVIIVFLKSVGVPNQFKRNPLSQNLYFIFIIQNYFLHINSIIIHLNENVGLL